MEFADSQSVLTVELKAEISTVNKLVSPSLSYPFYISPQSSRRSMARAVAQWLKISGLGSSLYNTLIIVAIDGFTVCFKLAWFTDVLWTQHTSYTLPTHVEAVLQLRTWLGQDSVAWNSG